MAIDAENPMPFFPSMLLDIGLDLVSGIWGVHVVWIRVLAYGGENFQIDSQVLFTTSMGSSAMVLEQPPSLPFMNEMGFGWKIVSCF